MLLFIIVTALQSPLNLELVITPRIKANEQGNRKFNFLKEGDPYHAYYLHKVKDFIEGKAQEPGAPQLPAGPASQQNKLQSLPVSLQLCVLIRRLSGRFTLYRLYKERPSNCIA